MLARSSAGRRQGLAEQHCLGTGSSTGTPLPSRARAGRPASLASASAVSHAGRDGPGQLLLRLQVGVPAARGPVGTAGPRSSGVADARCALLCREALADAEPVLSAGVRLSRGRKRSERRLLLLREELVVAKLR